MPTYLTAWFWLANRQAGVGLLCFALAVFLLRRWLAGEGRAFALAGAALAVAGCLLAYSLFGLALLFAPILLAWADGDGLLRVARGRRVWMASAAIAAAFAAAAAFKLSVGYGTKVDHAAIDFARQTAWLYARAGFTTLWTHGLAAPYYALRIATGVHGGWAGPIAALLVLLAVRARGPARSWGWPERTPTAGLIAAGWLVFALGYVPFLTNFWFGGSPFGTANRAHVAGALGAAMVFVAVVGALFRRRPAWGRAVLLLYCCAGIVTQVTIGRVWGAAWDEQNRLAREIATRAAPLPAGGTLLLYGHCPYFGPVPVFPPDSWIGKRIEMETGVPELAGNTIVPGTRTAPGGIEVRDARHLGDLPPGAVYPYPGTVIYDLREQRRHAIETRADAEVFFAAKPAARATGCRYRGHAGLPLW